MLKSWIRNQRIFRIPCFETFLNRNLATIRTNWGEDSQFLIPQKNTRNGAEFRIPKERGKSLRISCPPKNTEEVREFLITQDYTGEDSEFLILQRTQDFPLWAKRSHKSELKVNKGFWNEATTPHQHYFVTSVTSYHWGQVFYLAAWIFALNNDKLSVKCILNFPTSLMRYDQIIWVY